LQNFYSFVLYVFVSASVQAKAVERMQHKCEQKMATVVSEATRILCHELRTADRLGSVLQSKLNKAEVYRLFPLCLFPNLSNLTRALLNRALLNHYRYVMTTLQQAWL
jgi:hypothetical protein